MIFYEIAKTIFMKSAYLDILVSTFDMMPTLKGRTDLKRNAKGPRPCGPSDHIA